MNDIVKIFCDLWLTRSLVTRLGVCVQNKLDAYLTALRTFYYDVLLLTTAYSVYAVHFFLGQFPNMEFMLLLLSPLFYLLNCYTGFLLIFLTAGNLIAIGGYKMLGVWGQRPQRGPGATPRRGPRGSAPGGVKGQSPLRGPGAAPLEAIRFSQSDKVKSTQPVMLTILMTRSGGKKRKIIFCGPPQLQVHVITRYNNW